jgi:hypothetical protein
MCVRSMHLNTYSLPPFGSIFFSGLNRFMTDILVKGITIVLLKLCLNANYTKKRDIIQRYASFMACF